jgi:hypothetical protein
MAFGVSGALLLGAGSLAVGAYSADKAADQMADSTKAGLDQSLKITNQARNDVMTLFDNSAKKAAIGNKAALDFYKQNAQKRMQPFMQGNQAAQNVIGLGAQQANNAILGLPVDMSFTNQPQVQADYSGIQAATLPDLSQPQQGGIMGPQQIAPQQQEASQGLAVGRGGAINTAVANAIRGAIASSTDDSAAAKLIAPSDSAKRAVMGIRGGLF